MSFEVVGTLYKKFDTEKKTETFSAREFVIELPDERYPQYIKFQLTQDRCSLLDPMEPGDQVKVFFDLRGREWQDKFFTNLQAWRLEKVGDSPAQEPETNADFPPIASTPFDFESEENGGVNDLPF